MRLDAAAPAGLRVGGRRASTGGRRMVAALAVTQTVGYGTLYYAFAVLLAPMSGSLGASTTAVTGALTASVLASALAAVPVGRWLDRHGGRGLMTVGSLAATGLVLAWSQVHALWQLYAVMIGVGVAGAMVLYEPAFAVIVSRFAPPRRDDALLAVTVVAGFASTVFLPLTGLLVDRLDWRTALVVLAVVHGATTVPLHAAALRVPACRPPADGARVPPGRSRSARTRAIRDPRLWIIAGALVAHGAATSTMTVHLVGYLVDRGHPATFAATAAGLLGVLSVTGRLVLAGARRRLPVTGIVATIFALQAVAVLALPAVAGNRVGAVLGVVGFGLGFGVASLATPALLADRYGTAAYAGVAGLLAAPVTAARATAPLAAAALLHAVGYGPLLAAVAGCCALAAVGMLVRSAAPPPEASFAQAAPG
ncbi:Predicted arabinose efflux permease, MFS family [Micromonospora citrea]|uniref:Predicted arabinose efflux permease, MFS family n=1 Tax=Micromonospora citrea TaxID=47855 RepID=A0A1C6W121_9ACTN|nr:MFS transporter [Micromonospora citrea]SCL72238.1 Predicted arabinose efflux permease, MFS family [Micromonospora citrea]